MSSSAFRSPSGVRSGELLITRLITGIGIALLLLVGVWAAGHAESPAAASAPSEIAASVSLLVEAPQEVAASVDERLADAASCALGVLCGLALAVLVLLRRGVRASGVLSRTTVPVRSLLRCRVAPRAEHLTLSQLGLSRT